MQPVDPEKDDGFACLFVGKNGSGRICSLIFTRVSESRERYVVVDIPASTHLSVGSGYAPLYSILNGKDIAAVTSTISSLVGCDIDYCFVADASSLGQVAALHGNMSVTLPYAVRYLSPEFAVIPEEDRSEEHYVTIPAGSVRLNAENTPYILSAVPNGEKRIYIRLFAAGGPSAFRFLNSSFPAATSATTRACSSSWPSAWKRTPKSTPSSNARPRCSPREAIRMRTSLTRP